MEGRLQRLAGIEALAGVVAALQVRAAAETASGTGDHEAADGRRSREDRVQRLVDAVDHIHRKRVQDLLVVEAEGCDVAGYVQADALEIHGSFPRLIAAVNDSCY